MPEPIADQAAAGGRGIREKAAVASVLLALVIAKVLIAALLYDPARVWLHQDDYCRALMACQWGESPYLYPADLHWLPLPFYLYGSVSRLTIADSQLVFVLVSQSLAVLNMLAIYGLTLTCFSRPAALCAALLYAFSAWQAVMSFSALAEPLYYLLTCCGMWAFARWWHRDRTVLLAFALVFLSLATMTRYEAWLFLLIVDVAILVRCLKRRLVPSIPVVVLSALAWLPPAMWILVNLCEQKVPLVFYAANRQAFDDVLRQLSLLQRLLQYPTAFATLSIPLTLVLGIALVRARPGITAGSAGMLVAVTISHFAAMVALYVSGSGPSFVERIVLVHLYLLLPVAGAVLAVGGERRQHPIVRLFVLLFLFFFVGEQCWQAHRIIREGQCSDYRLLADDYTVVSRFLCNNLTSAAGDAAVHCPDGGFYFRFSSRRPERVLAVNSDNIADVLARRHIVILCVPRADAGGLRVDARIEKSFREAHRGDVLVESELGNWRVIQVAPKSTG